MTRLRTFDAPCCFAAGLGTRRDADRRDAEAASIALRGGRACSTPTRSASPTADA